MGTSLSGLTPATTFDGLLKTSDNDGLTTTKKTIGTGDGNDSQLKLATNSTQIGNIEFVSANVISTVSPSTNLRIVSGGIGINGDYSSPTANTRLHIKGSGATSATTSLLVQNSAGTQLLKINDDGSGFFGTYLQGQRVYATATGETFPSLSFAGSSGTGMFQPTSGSNVIGFAVLGSEKARLDATGLGIGETTPTARLHVKGSGNTNTTTSLLVQNSDGANLLKVDDSGIGVLVNDDQTGFIRLSASGEYGTIGGGRVLRINSGGANPLMIAGSGSNGVVIGSISATTLAANTALAVKGQGATSATTALLVQNSAGTNLMTMRDDGVFMLGAAGNTKFFEGTVVNSKFRVIDNSSLHTVHADGSTNPRVFLRSGPNNSEPNSHYVANYINGTYIGKDVVTPTSTLHVKGSGNTATTTALLVQNSAGSDILKVEDGGRVWLGDDNLYADDALIKRGTTSIQFGSAILEHTVSVAHSFKTFDGVAYTEAMRITGNSDQFVGIGESTPTARLQVKGSGATSATFALKAQNSGGETMFSIRDDKTIQIDGSRFTFNSSAFTSYADILLNTDLAVGTTTIAANTRAHIKGSGATSATTALLVQNSAGTELMKVEDGGVVQMTKLRSSSVLEIGASGVSKFQVTSAEIHPFSTYNLGKNNNASHHFENIYSKGVTHITDNTTSSTTLDASAKLQVDSTTQGFLPPRMTSEQKMTIASPAAGLMVYDTDQNQMNYWNGSGWIAF